MTIHETSTESDSIPTPHPDVSSVPALKSPFKKVLTDNDKRRVYFWAASNFPRLKANDKLVFLHILGTAFDKEYPRRCDHSQEAIAGQNGISKSSVIRSIKVLERAGLITIKRHSIGSITRNHYYHLPPARMYTICRRRKIDGDPRLQMVQYQDALELGRCNKINPELRAFCKEITSIDDPNLSLDDQCLPGLIRHEENKNKRHTGAELTAKRRSRAAPKPTREQRLINIPSSESAWEKAEARSLNNG